MAVTSPRNRWAWAATQTKPPWDRAALSGLVAAAGAAISLGAVGRPDDSEEWWIVAFAAIGAVLLVWSVDYALKWVRAPAAIRRAYETEVEALIARLAPTNVTVERVADPVLFEPLRIRIVNHGARGSFYARVTKASGLAPGDVNTPWNIRWRRDPPNNRICPLGPEESEILVLAEPWDGGDGLTFLSTPDKRYPARLVEDQVFLVVGIWNQDDPSASPRYCNVQIGYQETTAGTYEPTLDVQ